MAKKKHIVMARTDAAIKKGVTTSKGKLDFKGKPMMYVDDDLADEIDRTDGMKGSADVWVHEDPRLNWSTRYKADGVHSYFFGSTPRYAREYDRIFRKSPEEESVRDRKRKKRVSQEAEVMDG